MSKKRIILITALITLSLVGLVAVQLFWIQNAIVVKEEQLSHNVAAAMQSVVHKIETQEAVNALAQWKNIASQAEELSKQEYLLKTDASERAEKKQRQQKKPDVATDEEKRQEELSYSDEYRWDAADVAVAPRTSFQFATRELPEPPLPPQAKTRVEWNTRANAFKTKPKKTVIKFQTNDPRAIAVESLLEQPFELESIDSMVENLMKQQQVLMRFSDSMNRVFIHNGNIVFGHPPVKTKNKTFKTLQPLQPRTYTAVKPAENFFYKANSDQQRRNVSTLTPKREPARVRKKTIAPDTANIFKSALQQAIVSSMMKDKPVSERISKQQLDSLLKTELKSKGIDIAYEFGVVKNANDSVIFAKTKDNGTLLHAPYKAALFSNDMLVSEPYSLLVNFPNQKSHIFESLWLMLASSLAFILITIFSFSFTIVALVKQKKMSDIKTDFINNMTHEFKTPIATIGLASEALKEPKVLGNSDKVSRFVNVIQDENKRLSKQVERVLQAALIERGDLQLTFEDVHLHDAIDHVVHNIAVQVEARGGKIECIFKAKNPLILADDVHISNVFYNLLDNATKYSPEAPDITISTRNDERGVFVSVSDKGMGMTREALKQIFEKFYRVPTGNLHDVKGFGLGLSYVKAVVEAHGGTITVESELKKGSNFEVFLPYIHNTLV
ncbi:MAG: HAMP domain-containing sensor histidine kinase [Bacteroidota bacterium]